MQGNYLFSFPTQYQAGADPIVGPYLFTNSSYEVAVYDLSTGLLQPGFWLMIVAGTTPPAGFAHHPNAQIGINRELELQNQFCIIFSNLSVQLLANIQIDTYQDWPHTMDGIPLGNPVGSFLLQEDGSSLIFVEDASGFLELES